MKKNYFFALFAALMLFVAMPATAQVSVMSDLFGKWKFTATVTTTEAGAAHADKFKSECEVIIGKSESEYFMADIANFAGADYSMSVSGFNTSTYTIEINGPNSANYGIWEGYIAVANAEGEWPFSRWDVEGSVQYGMNMTVDPETKEITVPDFTIVSLDWQTYTPTVLANVTNAKMTVIELDKKDTSKYPDLTGLWTWEGGLRNADNQPNSFTVEFEQAGEGKDAWKATFAFGEYEPFTLDATFDGSLVTIPHDTIFFDRENGIRLGIRSSSKQYSGAFTFSYNSKTSMSLYDYIYVRRDTISTETGELAGAFVHQVFDGYITRENPDAYDWTGTYKVTVADYEDLDENDTISYSAEFDMVIEKKPGNIFAVTEFLGLKDLNITITPADDDKSATIDLGGYYGATLDSWVSNGEGDWTCHVITDANAEATSLTITMNEDGTFSFADFSVSLKSYNTGECEPLAAFFGAKATKEVFDWAGEYTLTATVEEFNTTKCASEFDVKIEKFNDTYFITQFDGDKVYTLNYGGIEIEVTGNKTAEIASGCFVDGTYPVYITLDGVDNAAIEMTMDNAGNINMADFLFHPFNYETYATDNPIAKYTNVVLTRKTTNIENIAVEENVVKGIFDLTGRKLDAITAPGLYIVNGKKVIVK